MCPTQQNISCIQNQYANLRICSLTPAYVCMGLLVIINITSIVLDIREINALTSHQTFSCNNALGKKRRLGHTGFYKIFDTFLHLAIITNVTLRCSRYAFNLDIPFILDNVTFYIACICVVWSILFVVQLIPYVGYIALVMKLMLVETGVFLIYMAVFMSPHSALFIRIINHKTPMNECNLDWNDFPTSIYNTFLLLFNMVNFQSNSERVNENVQLRVSTFLL